MDFTLGDIATGDTDGYKANYGNLQKLISELLSAN